MLQTPAKVNISDLIDETRIGGFQIGIYALCGASLVMAGFNAQAMGYVAPAIIADWNIAASELGPVFGAGNLGFLIGCLLFGILADKIGRRPVLVFFHGLLFCHDAFDGAIRIRAGVARAPFHHR